MPFVFINKIILKTAEAHAGGAIEIARLQPITQQPIDQKFVAIRAELFVAALITPIAVMAEMAVIDIAFVTKRHEVVGEVRRIYLPE